MTKTNYTKAEEAFAKGLLRMEVSKLLDIADQVTKSASAIQGKEGPKPTSVQRQLLIILKYELKRLKNLGHDPYKKFHLERKQFKRFLENPAEITIQEWENLKILTQQIIAFKTELEKTQSQTYPEEIIEQQRREQKTKRFNVSNKWLPLK